MDRLYTGNGNGGQRKIYRTIQVKLPTDNLIMVQIAFVGFQGSGTLDDMCIRALSALGYEVNLVSQKISSLPLFERFEFGTVSMQKRVVSECTEIDPAIVIILKGYNINKNTVQLINKTTDAVIANWNPDNPFQVRSRSERASTYLESLPAYDVVFTWGKFLEDRLKEHGAQRVEHLPFGYDPELHRPLESDPEYACDVIFLGHWSKKREYVLEHISELDVDFDLWGNHWKWRCWKPSLRRCLRGDALMGESYARAMSSAKLVVNVVADHNIPAYNMRTFEIPATLSLMLTTDTEGQREIFQPGQEIVTYTDAKELSGLIDYYLDADKERQTVAEKGFEAVQGHSYHDRMERVIEVARDLSR